MRLDRILVTALTVALLLGQTVVAAERAACDMPRGESPPACSMCAGEQAGPAPTITADRSCCKAPQPAAERDPARIASDRSTEARPIAAAFLPTAAPVETALLEASRLLRETHPSDLFPPPLRSTVLLI